MAHELGDRTGVAASLLNLGAAEMQRGDHERAETLLREGLGLARDVGDKISLAEGLEYLAGTSGARGRGERAARLYGAAEVLRESLAAPLLPAERPFYERHLVASRSQLDETAWEAAWSEGRAMTMEDAVGYALEEEQRA